MIRKYKNWPVWRAGLRSKAIKAGAEAISTQVTAALGTNGVANMGIPGLADIGMGWKTMLLTMGIQFGLRVIAAAAQYVKDNPEPELIEENFETDEISKPKPPTEPKP